MKLYQFLRVFLIFVVYFVCSVSVQAESTCSEKSVLLGKFSYRKHPDFVAVLPPFSSKKVYVRRAVAVAFKEMYRAALNDGVPLRIVSGTRSFWQQKYIWEKKWRKYTDFLSQQRVARILQYSAIPGTSRHHWGTDLDLNSLDNAYFVAEKTRKVYQWLLANAARFGFYQVYTSKASGRKGYEEEKWHWSYLPLASTYLQQYQRCVRAQDIHGFLGDDVVFKMEVSAEYIYGLNPAVLEEGK